MSKTPKIELNNWSLGISPDEYVGGSYFFAEGIDTQHSSKGFRLGPRVLEYTVNKRTNGTINKIIPFETNNLMFTGDGYLEYGNNYVGTPSEFFTAGTGGGGLFRRDDSTIGYTNGTLIGNKIYGLTRDRVDVITLGSTGNFKLFGNNLVTNPGLTSDTGWTVGAGWTTGPNGATHTSGTAVLEQTIATVEDKFYRIAIKFTKTAGSLSVKIGAGSAYGVASQIDSWSLQPPIEANGDNLKVILTPSNDFVGTVEYIQVNEYTATIEQNKITITNKTNHPMLYSQGYLYIASGNLIEHIDTTSLTNEKISSIIDSSYEIVALTEIGNSIIIWATDGFNSKQYFRDRVSKQPTEAIDWKGLKITAVTADGSINYVVTDGLGVRPKCYIVEGYQRQLLGGAKYDGRNTGDNWSVYHPSKKFNFYTHTPECIAIYNENIYVPCKGGIFVYGANIAGMNKSWKKGITYTNNLNRHIIAMSQINSIPYFSYKQTISGVDYNVFGVSLDYFCCSSGYLVTNPIYRDQIGTDKNLIKVKIGYKNIPKEYGNIKIYAIVDDYFFWNVKVSGLTDIPEIGDKYKYETFANLEVIETNITGGSGEITFKMSDSTIITQYQILPTGSLTKVTGDGDTSINYSGITHGILVKTIESDTNEYGNDIIFGNLFIEKHIPKRHKLQFIIELNTSVGTTNLSPEVYEITILSDIVNENI